MSQTPAGLRPLPGPVPVPAGTYDLAKLGYAEEEFLLAGDAERYCLDGDRAADGRWTARPAETAGFTTRLLVRRPADDTEFSGTVVVEWLNVSGGLDVPPIWMMAHTQLIRRRHAWVGVSAQRAGIEGGGLAQGLHLKRAFPDRYAILSHPGDAWSYDIFSQAGHAIRNGTGVLGPHTPRRLLAAGHSQSAAYLVTYLNAVDTRARQFDGFAVHGRGAVGAPLDKDFSPSRPGTLAAEQIRSDLRVPVIVVQTETDQVLLGGALAAQPDSDLLRSWELAGAAHGDTYLVIASGHDDGALPADRLAELIQPTTRIVMGTTEIPVNSGLQHHYIACAALDWLNGWAGGGAAPPASPRLHLSADGKDLQRDALGIATGGIRTPWTDVPAAVLSGLGQRGANIFAFLFGVTRPFAPDQLARLYPDGPAGYLQRFEQALDAAITAGFLLRDDRAEALAVAAAASRVWPADPGRRT